MLIGGGSGLVGKRLTELLLKKGYKVTHLSRKKGGNAVNTIPWDIEEMELKPALIEPFDYIINLAGTGIADESWTKKRKQLIINSRVKTTELLVNAISKNEKKPISFICASAVGYYGLSTSEHIFIEEDKAGGDFLADTCIKWENSANKANSMGVSTSTIRIGLVLSENGGALKELVKPIKYGLGAALGSGKQYMPWIHIDDLCSLFIHVMENKLIGAYNATAPNHVNNKTFISVLSSVLKKPYWAPNIPGFVISIILGSRKLLVLEGSKVSSEKVQNTGFQFQFESLKSALKDIFS